MKKIFVLVVCMIMLTACQNEEAKETDKINRETENVKEISTRIPNSIVGTWYQTDIAPGYGEVWVFTNDGKFDSFNEDDIMDEREYRYTYDMDGELLTILDSEGEMRNKFKVIYTDEGIKLLYKDEAGHPEFLYESKRYALELEESYYYSTEYYESIANEEGFVIEEGVLIRYVGDAKEITIPSNVERMGKLSMWGENLRKVTIPGTVKVIESAAFHDELDFRYIYIEEGVEEIGAGAFPDLVEIHFPKSVKKMGTDVFDTYEGSVDPDMKIYVKEGSYAHKYFIESGLEENLVFEE